MTLSAFDVRPTCDTADVQAILPFPPNPLKHVLCDVPECGVDALSAILVVSLEVVGRKIVLDETPHEEITQSGLVTGVARSIRCCLWPLHDQPIDLAGIHLGTPEQLQMLRSLCVIGPNFTILRHFILKLWRNENLR